MTAPLISVLMPAYNVEKYIEAAVQSILSQTYKNFELIIADDASTDDTFALIQTLAKKDVRIKYFRNEKNLGFVGNKNFLLSQATGEYITLQDSDDISHPQRLATSLKYLQDNSLVICGTGFIPFTDNDKIDYPPIEGVVENYIYRRPSKEYSFWYPSLIFHKSVIGKVGSFHNYFNGSLGEDYYWTFHVNDYFPIGFIKTPLYYYRFNPTSTTNTFKIKTMIMPLVLKELFRQFASTGSDWLSENKMEDIAAYEKQILGSKKIMAEQYRIWAAKAVDKGDKKLASELIKKSFGLNPLNKDLYKTIVYKLRS